MLAEERPDLLAGCGLAFLQTEGDEAMGRIVGREADGHSITGNHANTKTPHPPGELSRDLLPAFESNLIAATAENLVDATGRLNQVVSRQIESILPTSDRGRQECREPISIVPSRQRTRPDRHPNDD